MTVYTILQGVIPTYIIFLSMMIIYNWFCGDHLFTNLITCFGIITCASIVHIILWYNLDQDYIAFEIFDHLSSMIHENLVLAYITMGLKSLICGTCGHFMTYWNILWKVLFGWRLFLMVLHCLTIDYTKCRCGPSNMKRNTIYETFDVGMTLLLCVLFLFI